MRTLLAPLQSAPLRVQVFFYLTLLSLVAWLYLGHADFLHGFLYGFFDDAASTLQDRNPAGSPHAGWLAQGWQYALALLLMVGVPAVLWRRLLRRPWKDCGLGLGDWRFGLRVVAVAAPLLVLPLWVNAGSPAFQEEYPLVRAAGASVGAFLLWEALYAVYYVSWETFFRGFWQLGLAGWLGVAGALATQTAVSTVMHIGKPPAETFTAVLGGVLLGLLATRTRSVWYGFLLHAWLGGITDLFCIMRSGPVS